MKALDIALKDFVRQYRNLVAFGMMFAAPLLITGLIALAFGGMVSGQPASLPDFRVLVVDHDQATANAPDLGNMLLTFLQDERMPDWLVIEAQADEVAARAELNAQKVGALVLVPEGFSASLVNAGQTAELVILHDPTLTIGPQVLNMLIGQFLDGVRGAGVAAQTAFTTWEAQGVPVDGEKMAALTTAYADWYTNTQQDLNHGSDPALLFLDSNSGDQASTQPMQSVIGLIFAGMLVFFVYFGAANTAESILSEEEEGTLARLFTTPTSRTSVLLGKALSVLLVILVQALVLIAASALLFKIQWGNPLTLALVLFGVIISAAGFGIFLISLIKNSRQAGPVLGGVLTVTGMLGGLITVAVQMPAGFAAVNKVVPQGWALHGLRAALEGGSPLTVLPGVIAMLVWGLALFAAGNLIFRRRLA